MPPPKNPPKNKRKRRYVVRRKVATKKGGRPTVMTKTTLGKLEDAFRMGSSDREACLYAKINPDTLYRYQRENEGFSEQKEAWKSHPVLAARKVVMDNIQRGDLATAKWYLERKTAGEFSNNVQVNSNGKEMLSVMDLYDTDDV